MLAIPHTVSKADGPDSSKCFCSYRNILPVHECKCTTLMGLSLKEEDTAVILNDIMHDHA